MRVREAARGCQGARFRLSCALVPGATEIGVRGRAMERCSDARGFAKARFQPRFRLRPPTFPSTSVLRGRHVASQRHHRLEGLAPGTYRILAFGHDVAMACERAGGRAVLHQGRMRLDDGRARPDFIYSLYVTKK